MIGYDGKEHWEDGYTCLCPDCQSSNISEMHICDKCQAEMISCLKEDQPGNVSMGKIKIPRINRSQIERRGRITIIK